MSTKNSTNNNGNSNGNTPKKNFIQFTTEERASMHKHFDACLDIIQGSIEMQAQAFPIAQKSQVKDPLLSVDKSLEAATAGICVIAFGPLAVLLMAQINVIPQLYNQIQIMHLREQKHNAQESALPVSPLVV